VLYNVLFDVDNSDAQLLPQMSAQVFFVLAKAQNALLMPVAALGKKQSSGTESGAADKTYRVRVITALGGAEDRSVVVGVTNRLSAQVVSGLAEGDEVVLNPTAPNKREAKSSSKADAKAQAKSGPKLKS
jgi:membrane fusion protein, macrolide-specific efflux system